MRVEEEGREGREEGEEDLERNEDPPDLPPEFAARASWLSPPNAILADNSAAVNPTAMDLNKRLA